MTDAITRSPTATGEQNDPVAQLAQAVRCHIATDGAEPVREVCEIAVLERAQVDHRSIAASLYLAQDIAAGGDQQEGWRHVAQAAQRLADNDDDLRVIGKFYAQVG